MTKYKVVSLKEGVDPVPTEKIEKTIEEKAFMIDRQKESAAQLKEIHPDITGTAEKISSTIEKRAKEIEEQKEIVDHQIDIKKEAESIVEKFESEVDKIKKDDDDEP